MSEDKLYLVEKILNRRKINGSYEYKIKWVGYPMSESTWEPLINLETAKEMVAEYDKAHPISKQNKPSKSKSRPKKESFINKKRKEEKTEKIGQNEKISDEFNKNNDIDLKEKDNKNTFEKAYYVDESLKDVFTVKQQNQKLMALVSKLDSNGNIIKSLISTEELKKTNPWILINFYESKIKFS